MPGYVGAMPCPVQFCSTEAQWHSTTDSSTAPQSRGVTIGQS